MAYDDKMAVRVERLELERRLGKWEWEMQHGKLPRDYGCQDCGIVGCRVDSLCEG